MNKQQFISALNAIYKQKRVDNKFSKNMKKCFPDDSILLPPTADIMDGMISLIADLTGFGKDWIDWWVYENEFGKKGLECFIKTQEYTLKDTGELYDFLILTK